jgi:hypothetical protein
LTKKDQPFAWSPDAEDSFQHLKRIFTTEPTLAQFDFDKPTRVEADSSGWCIGGTLLQPNPDGLFLPCAFFSKKLSPAECNYEIYDKEMLAIVRSLEEWESELRGVQGFEVLSDHKNLEYFMTVQKLTERQIRWSLILSRFNFKIRHIDGKDNILADALSRRDQDLPVDEQDDRIQERQLRLLKPHMIQLDGSPIASTTTLVAPIALETPFELFADWDQAIEHDEELCIVYKAVQEGHRKLPSRLLLKLSIAECSIVDSRLMFRNRLWVPKQLRTALVQATHDSLVHVHPG